MALIQLPPDRIVRLKNIDCPYCGVYFDRTVAKTVDHVVGRNFVPKGSLTRLWKLHVAYTRYAPHETKRESVTGSKQPGSGEHAT